MKRIFVLMIFVATQAFSSVFSPEEIEVLKANYFANFQPNGAIVASPSQADPNYFYDWIRDSAIAMSLIETWLESSPSTQYKQLLMNYVTWSERIQHQYQSLPGQDILGEPKFNIDGTPFDGPWGRPQNDGPALRASVLIRFANQLLDHDDTEYVLTHLYNGNMDPYAMGVVKMDLEYTAHHWQDENFDLWEEVYGHHFFTAMAQQRALFEGAILARRLNDEYASRYYETQAQLITNRLNQHVDSKNMLIKATLPPHSGPQKTMELDTSVILGILLNPQNNGHLSPNSALVKNTVDELHQQFNAMFPINNQATGAILFGRYPGDTYDGHHTNSHGNPWFILTATIAEYYYTVANSLPLNEQTRPLILKYSELGDDYLQLIKKYAPDLRLSEQINSATGVQQGAVSLTWSYVSVLRAIHLSEVLESKLKGNLVSASRPNNLKGLPDMM